MSQLVKTIIFRVIRIITGIRMCKGSYISLPYLDITGGKYIKVGKGSIIGKRVWLAAFSIFQDQKFSPSIEIGNFVTIGNYFCLTSIDHVYIGDGCLVSEYVYISDHFHGTEIDKGSPATQPLYSKGPVTIGENSFIGYRVSILSGVTLGKHCVVGANSVVTKSFPDYSVVAGAPARLIKQFDEKTQTWIHAAI